MLSKETIKRRLNQGNSTDSQTNTTAQVGLYVQPSTQTHTRTNLSSLFLVRLSVFFFLLLLLLFSFLFLFFQIDGFSQTIGTATVHKMLSTVALPSTDEHTQSSRTTLTPFQATEVALKTCSRYLNAIFALFRSFFGVGDCVFSIESR